MVFKNKDFRRLNIQTSIIFPLINSGTDCHAELKKDKSWFEKILTPWKKKKPDCIQECDRRVCDW